MHVYGRAWETQDTNLLLSLFTKDGSYQVSPFERPFKGCVILCVVKLAHMPRIGPLDTPQHHRNRSIMAAPPQPLVQKMLVESDACSAGVRSGEGLWFGRDSEGFGTDVSNERKKRWRGIIKSLA